MKIKVSLLFILIYICATLSVFSNPQDYPPTAFQLAQIAHYATHEAEVKRALFNRYDKSGSSSGTAITDVAGAVQKLSAQGLAASFLGDAERLIVQHIGNVDQATEAEWSAFMDHMLATIKTRPKNGDGFIESFEEEACKPIILSVILAEQKAMQSGKVMLWRAVTQQEKLDWIDKKVCSYSLGLFSGFIFDGFKYHNYGVLSGNGSACTYSYLSPHMMIKRLIAEAKEGRLLAEIQAEFPAFFDFENLVSTRFNKHKNREGVRAYVAQNSLQSLLFDIANYYLEDVKMNRKEFFKSKYNQLKSKTGLINSISPMHADKDGYKDISGFTLFGVAVDQVELDQRRKDSKADQVNNKAQHKSLREYRGEYVQPEHAVYGKGELFHPKEKFPTGTKVNIIYQAGQNNAAEDDHDEDND